MLKLYLSKIIHGKPKRELIKIREVAMIKKTHLIASAIAIGAVVSLYLLFSANVVPIGMVSGGPKQTTTAVTPKARQVSPSASKPIRPASKTTAFIRSGPPSKRF